MLHWRDFSPRLAPTVPGGAARVGPPKTEGRGNGDVNDYEILLMLDPEAAEGRHDEILARTRELVETGGGAWQGHEPWGRRKLAYEINHKGEGTYHLLTFACEPATLDEVSRILKISDGVMRHLATRRPTRYTGTGEKRDTVEAAAPAPLPEEEVGSDGG
jgi:small subunit ribosomal protein S6